MVDVHDYKKRNNYIYIFSHNKDDLVMYVRKIYYNT